MAEPDPPLPTLDPRSATANEAAALARELVTAYLAVGRDPVLLGISMRSALDELYGGLQPTPAHTERAASLLCSLAALLQVALSSVGQLAFEVDVVVSPNGDDQVVDVALVFEQLVASAVDDGLTF